MILRICGIALLASAVGMMLGEMGFRGRRLIGCATAVMLMIAVLDGVGEILADITSLTDAAGVSQIALSALKIVGVGYVSGICSDIAAELGESSIAGVTQLVGKIEMMLIVMPYLREILETGIGLLK